MNKRPCIWFIHQGPVIVIENAMTKEYGIYSEKCLNCEEVWDKDD